MSSHFSHGESFTGTVQSPAGGTPRLLGFGGLTWLRANVRFMPGDYFQHGCGCFLLLW